MLIYYIGTVYSNARYTYTSMHVIAAEKSKIRYDKRVPVIRNNLYYYTIARNKI